MWRMFIMRSFSRSFFNKLAEALHKAVPAVSHKRAMPRFRLLGEQLLPYHYMQPALVPVQQQARKA
jgi:hypothetical protein